MNEIEKYLNELDKLVSDINVHEINDHIRMNNLNEWVHAWQAVSEAALIGLKHEIKKRSNNEEILTRLTNLMY